MWVLVVVVGTVTVVAAVALTVLVVSSARNQANEVSSAEAKADCASAVDAWFDALDSSESAAAAAQPEVLNSCETLADWDAALALQNNGRPYPANSNQTLLESVCLVPEPGGAEWELDVSDAPLCEGVL